MADEPTLKDALGDVRRAFRLMWCYQDRVFDIIRTVSGEFESLKFYYWVPQNSKPIDRSTNPVSRNPWYTIPMMNISYLYRFTDGDPNFIKPGDWLLDVHLVSDSGFSENDYYKANPDPAAFPEIEASESRLDLYVFRSTGEIASNWLKIWDQLDWPDRNSKAVQDADQPVTSIGTSFDIADLPDKEAVQVKVREFKKTLSSELGADFT